MFLGRLTVVVKPLCKPTVAIVSAATSNMFDWRARVMSFPAMTCFQEIGMSFRRRIVFRDLLPVRVDMVRRPLLKFLKFSSFVAGSR